jgi:hypothetical protein
MTELSPACTMTTPGDPFEKRVSTVGRVFPQVECKIVDPSTGRAVPRGTPGEVLARGYNVMLGYWDDPQATAEVIDGARWMDTGDLATMDAEGYVNIVGRSKDMIIRGGENVYPREIEEFLYTHPAGSATLSLLQPSERCGELNHMSVDCDLACLQVDVLPLQFIEHRPNRVAVRGEFVSNALTHHALGVWCDAADVNRFHPSPSVLVGEWEPCGRRRTQACAPERVRDYARTADRLWTAGGCRSCWLGSCSSYLGLASRCFGRRGRRAASRLQPRPPQPPRCRGPPR